MEIVNVLLHNIRQQNVLVYIVTHWKKKQHHNTGYDLHALALNSEFTAFCLGNTAPATVYGRNMPVGINETLFNKITNLKPESSGTLE